MGKLDVAGNQLERGGDGAIALSWSLAVAVTSLEYGLVLRSVS